MMDRQTSGLVLVGQSHNSRSQYMNKQHGVFLATGVSVLEEEL